MPAKRIGITTTLPIEILIAAGFRPVDLNDLLVSSANPAAVIEHGERLGFPQNLCAWNRGNYAVVKQHNIRHVVVVGSGDCSTSRALGELLEADGVRVSWFSYPPKPDRKMMLAELRRFAHEFGVDLDAAEEVRKRLRPLRDAALEIDETAWRTGLAHGKESEWALTSCSDLLGNPLEFKRQLNALRKEILKRREPPRPPVDVAGVSGSTRQAWKCRRLLRLAYIGVPTLVQGFHDFLEVSGAVVVFHEMQRQFAMPGRPRDLAEQYCSYTYPYGLEGRIADILSEVKKRNVDGIIHHVQSFCHRQAHDVIFRRRLGLPILTLETGGPCPVDGRLATRIHAFLEMLE